MNAFEFGDEEEAKSARSSRRGGRSKKHSHDDDDDDEDDRRPAKKSTSPMKPILLVGGGIVAGMVLLVVIAVVFFGSKATKLATNTDKPATNADRTLTIPAVDEEFRIAASQKSQQALGAAKILIELRNSPNNFSWEQLEDKVDFQFGAIKAEFGKWKRDRITAGDRYK